MRFTATKKLIYPFLMVALILGTAAMVAAADTSLQKARDAEKRKDYASALTWYRQAAQEGSAEAERQIGTYYLAGMENIVVNHGEALSWFLKAAEKGDWKAQEQAAFLLFSGDGVQADQATAVQLLVKVADVPIGADLDRQIASVGATCLLGLMYENGWGVPRNPAEAARRYRMPAERGYAIAQHGLAALSAAGGIPSDRAEAAAWFRKCAGQGDTECLTSLGVISYSAEAGKGALPEAVTWFRRSAEQGDRWGQFSLATCYYAGTGVARDYAAAAGWYRKAAEQGLMEAQYRLGTMYDTGTGVKQDHAAAVSWYRRAAEQGHAGAQKRLGDHVASGLGVPRNFAEAEKWYRQAAEQGNEAASKSLALLKKAQIQAAAAAREGGSGTPPELLPPMNVDETVGLENTASVRAAQIERQEMSDRKLRARREEGCHNRCATQFKKCCRTSIVNAVVPATREFVKDAACNPRCSDQQALCLVGCNDFRTVVLHPGSNHPVSLSRVITDIRKSGELLHSRYRDQPERLLGETAR